MTQEVQPLEITSELLSGMQELGGKSSIISIRFVRRLAETLSYKATQPYTEPNNIKVIVDTQLLEREGGDYVLAYTVTYNLEMMSQGEHIARFSATINVELIAEIAPTQDVISLFAQLTILPLVVPVMRSFFLEESVALGMPPLILPLVQTPVPMASAEKQPKAKKRAPKKA